MKSLSRVQLFVTPWTVAYQAPLSLGFSRQEYWNGLPFSSPGDLPNPGIEPGSPVLQADALPSEPETSLVVEAVKRLIPGLGRSPGESESEVAQSCRTRVLPVVSYQAPPSLGFSRQEYWSGLPFSSPGDLPNPGIEPESPVLQADT